MGKLIVRGLVVGGLGVLVGCSAHNDDNSGAAGSSGSGGSASISDTPQGQGPLIHGPVLGPSGPYDVPQGTGGAYVVPQGTGGAYVVPQGTGGAYVVPQGTGGADTAPPDEAPEQTYPSELASAFVDGTLGCHSFEAVKDQPFVDDPAVSALPIAGALARVSGRMQGSWVGTAEAPFGFVPQHWTVSVEFGADGTYSASGLYRGADAPPFYYGETAQCPAQRYGLSGLSAEGASGDIDIAFKYGDFCDLPGWQGELSNLRVDEAGVRLRFDFATSSGYGPIHYELRRACKGD